ncbi:hypothetical protein BX666DRAFT_101411 [Dichotomocladium elegans]|nr:hypothetical protein BX666DRAFT_101411 [Dichotomocladium elegans]
MITIQVLVISVTQPLLAPTQTFKNSTFVRMTIMLLITPMWASWLSQSIKPGVRHKGPSRSLSLNKRGTNIKKKYEVQA